MGVFEFQLGFLENPAVYTAELKTAERVTWMDRSTLSSSCTITDFSFVFPRDSPCGIYTFGCFKRRPLLHVSLSTIRRVHVLDAFVYQFGHHLSHRSPLHTRSPRGNTVSDQRVRYREIDVIVRLLPCVSSSSLGFQTETRRNGVTRPSAYPSFSLTLQTFTPVEEKRLTRSLFNTVSTPPNERHGTSPRQGPRSSAR